MSGFGGLRVCSGELVLDPALPAGISRLCFGLRWQGMRLTVEVRPDQVTYSLRDGARRLAAAAARRRAADRLRRRAGHPQAHPVASRCCRPRSSRPAGSPCTAPQQLEDAPNLTARGPPPSKNGASRRRTRPGPAPAARRRRCSGWSGRRRTAPWSSPPRPATGRSPPARTPRPPGSRRRAAPAAATRRWPTSSCTSRSPGAGHAAGAGAADPAAALLRQPDAVADRGPARHLADARVPSCLA